jgi:transcriptional regulator with XRE-family HTH domain
MTDISIHDIDEVEPESMKAIGVRLSQTRLEKGKTMQELAVLLEVDEGVISRIEKGEEFPSFEIMHGLFSLFNTSTNWLISGEEPEYFQTDTVPGETDVNKCFKCDKKYAELFELMQIPEIERIIFHKIMELKLFFKAEIERFNQSQKNAKQTGANILEVPCE